MSTTPTGRTPWRVAALAATTLALGGLTACGDDVEGVDRSEIEQLSEELGDLDERVTGLEEAQLGAEPEDLDETPVGAAALPFADDTVELSQEVTVTGEVTELYDTTDAGAAFRIIGDDVTEPVAVVTTSPPEELLANDMVEVRGTVERVGEVSFERTFGIPADELLNNAEGFFVDAEGEVAIDAESVEVVSADAD